VWLGGGGGGGGKKLINWPLETRKKMYTRQIID
jgi:hypothetical protein